MIDSNRKIAVVIPTYMVKNKIENVIRTIPDFVTYIIVVDDKCPQKSGAFIDNMNLNRVIVIFHEQNQGVGGAVITGYLKAKDLNCDIVVKMDGDGQMDPLYLNKLIEPIINNNADYTKGNRFTDFTALKSMPRIRLFGNSILSFLIKIASGYWSIIDPTNGYTAITIDALDGLNLNQISKSYFFESDMLINLNIEEKIVQDVSIPANYNDENSSLNIIKILIQFPPKIVKGIFKRILLKYFIYNFNMVSIYLLFGLPMLSFGSIFGIVKWIESINTAFPASTGTVMLSVLPIILGVQFLLQAISLDISNVPKKLK